MICLGPIDTNNAKDIHFIDVFNYENLAMEYDFQTGSTSLYLQKNEDEYELLYETVIENGIENTSFYSKDSVYILTNYDHNTKNILSLDYWKKSDFIKFINKFENDPANKFDKLISSFSYIPFMLKYSKRMIEDSHYYDTIIEPSIFNNYKKLFIKYTASTKLIPAYCILDSIITKMHNYISTQKFDRYIFEKNLSELENFKDVCPNSTSTLKSFLKNPTQTDLHKVCDLLEKNLNNIYKLINIYLEEELSIAEKGEKYDSE